MEPKTSVLVTDGQERSALAITRGLGRAGIPVIVGAETAEIIGRSIPILCREMAVPLTAPAADAVYLQPCRGSQAI